MTLQDRQPLVREILSWPVVDRGDLAAKLLESLDTDEDANAVDLWADEIRLRIAEMEAGQAEMSPWLEARKQILADEDGGS